MKANLCRDYTVTDFIGFSYCKSGGCYGRNRRQVNFRNDKIEVTNSASFSHWTTLGVGSETWAWSNLTDDGGLIRATRIQHLPLAPGYHGQSYPLDETIHFASTNASGDTLDTWSVWVPGAESVSGIFESEGRIYLVKEGISVSELECYETPPPLDGVDLEVLRMHGLVVEG